VLPLVHFSAQTEPSLTLKSSETTQRITQKVLTTSRKLDECEPLMHGANPILPSKRNSPERLVSMTGVSVRPGSAGPNVGQYRMTPG